MLKTVPTGVIDFGELVNGDYYFIDKTLMIQEFLQRKSKVTLITRPRRFGKTINMSMMAEFFDITKDSSKLFEGTKIMETEYASEMNKYPTIFISFADAKREKTSVVSAIKTQILKEWKRNKFIFDNLDEYDQIRYNAIKKVISNTDDQLTGIDYAIAFLMERLQAYYGKEVMVFIDEYDTPFIEAYVGGFYKEIRNGVAALLHNSLKTSTSLKYALLSGIQRVAKENIFSDLNNVKVCTVANKEYASYFGFTTKETKEILEYYGLELTDKVKRMYDGYNIGGNDIYNSWSIINYVDGGTRENYWLNTSSNVMIRYALEKINSTSNYFKSQYEKLIINGKLETEVALQTSFYEKNSISTLWGLLVNAGYLTIEKVVSYEDDEYIIKIPNKEIRKAFIELTEYYLKVEENKINDMLKALRKENKELFFEGYQNILMIPSYHDLRNENSYHMMMLGMCICLYDDYKVISNREEGKGRCDIILQAKDVSKPSFVIEFKYLKEDVKDIEGTLNKLADKGIKQIIDNKYDHELNGKVIYISLAHHRKDVVMKWVEK